MLNNIYTSEDLAKVKIGKLIKDFRLRKVGDKGKHWSQLALANSIGWDNPSTLSRIENGQIKPYRDTILKISQCLDLNNEDTNTLLKKAGYSEYGERITPAYSSKLINNIKNELELYNFPVMINPINNLQEIVYINSANSIFFTEYENSLSLIKDLRGISFFDIMFTDDFGFKKNILNYEEFTYSFTSNIFMMYSNFTNEEESLNINKNLDKYKDFRDAWRNISNKDHNSLKIKGIPLEYNIYKLNKKIKFLILTFPIYIDTRFLSEHFVPTNNKLYTEILSDLAKINLL